MRAAFVLATEGEQEPGRAPPGSHGPWPVHRPGSFSDGITLVEMLIGLALFGLILGIIVWLLGHGSRSGQRLSTQMAVHQASRKALVRFLQELQEGIEVIRPTPGTTLSYALVRDKYSCVRWFRQVPRPGSGGLYDLRRYADDLALPMDRRDELLLSDVKRLTFTARSEGALQINIVLAEKDRDYALLTTVRLRNLPSAEELW